MEEQKINKDGEAGHPAETSEQKCKRLATMRVNNALQKIKLIGNLAGPAYKYSEEEATKIIQGLKFAVEEIEAKFKKGKKKEDGFQL
ncbi:MAG: hypothetical protein KKI13_03675 [Candidatus Omnitrophica bacterium]|nr:hypothetical protein [Candidatus Omnitrophota bacterium]MCG2704535.1 hypothetical protein [Candidatus Omnitrophota bacterium]